MKYYWIGCLKRYGITGSSVQECFASYLSSRTQFVQIECSSSSLRELWCTAGVCHGPHRAARIVTFTKKYEHITPSLIDLHWLPVEYRIIYNILLLLYKAINGLSPSYISNFAQFL